MGLLVQSAFATATLLFCSVYSLGAIGQQHLALNEVKIILLLLGLDTYTTRINI